MPQPRRHSKQLKQILAKHQKLSKLFTDLPDATREIQGHSGLLSLPLEIRLMIFHLLLSVSGGKVFNGGSRAARSGTHYLSGLSLFRVNKQIHTEALIALADVNTYSFSIYHSGWQPSLKSNMRSNALRLFRSIQVCVDLGQIHRWTTGFNAMDTWTWTTEKPLLPSNRPNLRYFAQQMIDVMADGYRTCHAGKAVRVELRFNAVTSYLNTSNLFSLAGLRDTKLGGVGRDELGLIFIWLQLKEFVRQFRLRLTSHIPGATFESSIEALKLRDGLEISPLVHNRYKFKDVTGQKMGYVRPEPSSHRFSVFDVTYDNSFNIQGEEDLSEPTIFRSF